MSHKKWLLSIWAVIALSTSITARADNAQPEETTTVETTADQHSKPAPYFSEEELEHIIKERVDEAGIKEKEKLKLARKQLAQQLAKYKVTGVASCVDSNVALIYDSQNPTFEVTYKNDKGEFKTRKYEAEISIFGLKIQAALKFNLIFITGSDFNFYNSNKKIHLGLGGEVNLNSVIFLLGLLPSFPKFNDPEFLKKVHHTALLNIVSSWELLYAPFKNVPGSMIMVSFSGLSLFNFGLGIVTGGTLKPIKEEQ